MNLRNTQFWLLFALLAFGMLLAATPAAYAGEPCCQITAINTQTGVVTAKVNATGQVFQFTLNNRAELRQLRVGQGVYANLSSKTISLDGRAVAGSVMSIAAPAAPIDGGRVSIAPVDGARAPATSATAAATTSPAASSAGTSASGAAATCCSITAINSSTGVVTAKVNATGQTFQFNLNNPAQLHSLQVGQGVYANLEAKQVSLDGKSVSGAIKTIQPAANAAATSTAVPPPSSQIPAGTGNSGATVVPGFIQAAVDLLTKSRDFKMPGYPTGCMVSTLYFNCSHDPTVRLIRSAVNITQNGSSSYAFSATMLGKTVQMDSASLNSELEISALTGNIAGSQDYMQLVLVSPIVVGIPNTVQTGPSYNCAVTLNANRSDPITVGGTLNFETAPLGYKLSLASGLQVLVPAGDLQLDRPDSSQCPTDFTPPPQFPVYVQTSIAGALAAGWKDPMCSSVLGAPTPCTQSGTP